jgi:hypothetical protein
MLDENVLEPRNLRKGCKEDEEWQKEVKTSDGEVDK